MPVQVRPRAPPGAVRCLVPAARKARLPFFQQRIAIAEETRVRRARERKFHQLNKPVTRGRQVGAIRIVAFAEYGVEIDD